MRGDRTFESRHSDSPIVFETIWRSVEFAKHHGREVEHGLVMAQCQGWLIDIHRNYECAEFGSCEGPRRPPVNRSRQLLAKEWIQALRIRLGFDRDPFGNSLPEVFSVYVLPGMHDAEVISGMFGVLEHLVLPKLRQNMILDDIVRSVDG